MSLISCKECGKEISKTAKTCPNCGAKNRKSSRTPIILLLVIIIFIFFYIIGSISNKPSRSTGSQTASSTYSPTAPPELPPIDVAPGMTPAQLKAATVHLRKKVDEVQNTTYYFHQNEPKYDNACTAIQIYFGCPTGSVLNPYAPSLMIHYVAENWLFISRYVIKADDESFEYHRPTE